MESDGSQRGMEGHPPCCLGVLELPVREEELELPFQVVQQEEEGQQVGLWE